MKVACQYCRFFNRLESGYTGAPSAYGECRYNPPQVADSYWPRVGEDSWCGKFERGKTSGTGKLIRPVKAPQAW